MQDTRPAPARQGSITAGRDIVTFCGIPTLVGSGRPSKRDREHGFSLDIARSRSFLSFGSRVTSRRQRGMPRRQIALLSLRLCNLEYGIFNFGRSWVVAPLLMFRSAERRVHATRGCSGLALSEPCRGAAQVLIAFYDGH